MTDIALLATAQSMEAKRLREALEQTFSFRNTHLLPTMLPDPLPAWKTPYAAMAREEQLAWTTLDEVTKAAKTFLDPVLAGNLDAAWNPGTWTWRDDEHGCLPHSTQPCPMNRGNSRGIGLLKWGC